MPTIDGNRVTLRRMDGTALDEVLDLKTGDVWCVGEPGREFKIDCAFAAVPADESLQVAVSVDGTHVRWIWFNPNATRLEWTVRRISKRPIAHAFACFCFAETSASASWSRRPASTAEAFELATSAPSRSACTRDRSRAHAGQSDAHALAPQRQKQRVGLPPPCTGLTTNSGTRRDWRRQQGARR